MNINRKRIIKELITKKAEIKGYKYYSARKLLVTRPLGFFVKEIAGHEVGFDIIEDLLNEGVIIFQCLGERFSYKYTDEQSFEGCIKQIADYLEKEGYEKLEKALAMSLERKEFAPEDYLYVLHHYQDIATNYINEQGILKNSPEKAIDVLCDDLNQLFDDEFEKVKDTLVTLSATLICIVMYYSPDTEIKVMGAPHEFALVRITNRVAITSPLNLIYKSYIKKDCTDFLKSTAMSFFD